MTCQIPDPRTLKTWDEAFKYPLPVVRRLEQQLRKNVDENRSKLRSLVGASYRDLLGTAERIVEMDEQVRQVEAGLGQLGSKCNARIMERIGESHAKMRLGKRGDEEKRERYAGLAQTKVLQSALMAARRTMKAGGDSLLVAKLLVLARLLHKSLSDGEHPPGVLEDFQRDLGRLRKKLLNYVEKALIKETTSRETLTNTLCAYALVSSSAPKDVLRRFLQVRFQQVEAAAEEADTEDVLRMLRLYEHTMLDTRALFPRLLLESLTQLTRGPLLDDLQMRQLPSLNLDVYGDWIAERVRTFTPWVRHDKLVLPDVNNALASWSKQAQQCAVDAIKECLEQQLHVDAVIDARKKTIMQYLHLSSSRSGEGDVYGETIVEVRQAFADKLKDIATSTAESLQAAKFQLDEPVEELDAPTSLNLWQLASRDMQLSRGARRFRDDITSRRHGRNAVLKSFVSKFDDWMHRVDALHRALQQMKTAKWDDQLDVDLEDVPNGDVIKEDLNKRDPSDLLKHLESALAKALDSMYGWIRQNCSDEGIRAALLLRLLRELEQRKRIFEAQYSLSIPDVNPTEIVQTLQDRIVQDVIQRPIEQYGAALKKRRKVSTALWDGAPPLPVQPMPATYKFLAALHSAMSEAGPDLWSPHAVAGLKRSLDSRLAELLSSSSMEKPDIYQDKDLASDHADDSVEDGSDDQAPKAKDPAAETADNDDGKTLQGEVPLQLLFDTLYLQRIFSTPLADASRPGLPASAVPMRERLALEQALEDRLAKSANEYWKRTYLLFGLLTSKR